MKAETQDSSNPQTTAEDETLKRNTDCVYFLASPLTCKKGSECEYRHSEDARMNPRDCWYWMNGNCLNPKCSFRHPPLDGLLGTAVTTSTRSSLPPSLAPAPTQLSTAHNPASNLALGKQVNPHKQATPCYYFQKGLCLKGDRCAFMHEPLSFDNSVSQPPATKVAISVTEPQIPKKTIGGLQRCSTQQQKFPQGNIMKPLVAPAAKPPPKTEIEPSKNGLAVKKTVSQITSFNDELPRYKPTNVPPVISADSLSRTHRSRQAYPLDYSSFQNGKEPDEFLAESSPGFDVLVDDELRDSDYYHNEDEFGRMTGHEGRQANTVNEFDYNRSSDYSSVGKFDQETYNDSRGYDYGRMQDQFVQEQRRPSSERISERPVSLEKRGFSRAESPSQVNRSDLRHRLSKHRKVNGSRSAVSPDRRGEFYRRDDRDHNVGDQRYRDHSRRDPRSSIPRESSIISNRLQGRIKLPGRSSPDNHHNDSHQERETDRGRNWGRLSPPGRLPASSSHGRLQDRIKQRTQEDFTTEGRNFRGPPIKRDEVDNSTLNFAGPKSLAELKGSKVSDENHQRNTETRKLLSYQESEGSLSFEGPKPLNVILKRKREAGTAGSGDDTFSGNEEDISQRRRGELLQTSTRASGVAEKQSEVPFESKTKEAHSSKEEDVEEEEGLITAEGDDVTHEDHSFEQKGTELQEEDTTMTDKLEEQEFETFDQRGGESDDEPVEGGGDFKTEEDVNADAEEEEFSDDEDGDDFAKRIGVMFS